MAISCHGRETVVEKLVLAVIANGFCYGGGYYPVPEACTADGVMGILRHTQNVAVSDVPLYPYLSKGPASE